MPECTNEWNHAPPFDAAHPARCGTDRPRAAPFRTRASDEEPKPPARSGPGTLATWSCRGGHRLVPRRNAVAGRTGSRKPGRPFRTPRSRHRHSPEIRPEAGRQTPADGRTADALADYRELPRLAEMEAAPDELEVAIAQSALARSLLDAGNLEEAERVAHQSLRTLSDTDHPEAFGTCTTLALISWRKEGTVKAWLDEGFRHFEEAPLILHANKARPFESTADRLERGSTSRATASHGINFGAVFLRTCRC